MAAEMAKHPGGSLPDRHEGWAELTGAYRLLSNDKVEPAAVLDPHTQLTRAVMSQGDSSDAVLCVQDTTQLDFTRKQVQGLGEIGNGRGQGLLQHAAMAVSESGQTLGLLHVHWHARTKAPKHETRKQRLARPTEADVWEQTARHIGPIEGTRLIHVGDRHADVFGFMRAATDLGHGFVLRSFHDRRLPGNTDDQAKGDPPRLREALAKQKPCETRVFHIPARRDARGYQRKARKAKLSVRWLETSIPCPSNDPRYDRPIARAWAVQIREEHPPSRVTEAERIDWVLWTSEPIENADDAWQAVERYRHRWVIEEWHKALKQGCKIEHVQLKNAASIQRLAAVLGVVAVRLMQLRDAAAQADDEPPHDRTKPPRTPIADPVWRRLVAHLCKVAEDQVTDRMFFNLIAKKGGHLGRKHDSRPGWQCLWTGYQKLATMAQGAKALQCVEG